MADRRESDRLYEEVLELERELHDVMSGHIPEQDYDRVSELIRELQQRWQAYYESVRSQKGEGPAAT